MGEEGINVQVDETAICNCKILEPSHTLQTEDNNSIQWLMGGLED